MENSTKCPTRYAVRRITKGDRFYGKSHGSEDGNTTTCGFVLGGNWYITHTMYDGVVDCPKCLKLLKTGENT